MSEWAARRFWTETSVVPEAGGFAVLLDTRRLKTPARADLIVPTKAMAEALAAEWRAQTDRVDPRTMPVTRSANAALDRVAPQRPEVAAVLIDYGSTDLLCHRAETPEGLVERQAAAWDPILDWAGQALEARLVPSVGLMPQRQPEASLANLARRVHAMDPFRLTGFHDLVMLSGSLVLGFGVSEGRLDPETAWSTSRLDEEWQAEQWGRDSEAEATAAARREAFLHAARFHFLAADGPDEGPRHVGGGTS